MPQFRHPLIVGRVKELAAKHGLVYYSTSYSDAVTKTFSNLSQVSKDLRH